jgi:septum formation protein
VTRPIVLASTSPRRRDLLAQLRLPFVAVAPDYEEHDAPDADPVAMVRAHATGKARSVAALDPRRPVLGVDTTVVLDGRVYAKAASADEARAMIRAFAGRTHAVVSGLCLVGDDFEVVDHETTAVTFRRLRDPEIDAYVETGQWQGLAGAYAVQGLAAAFVTRVEGDFANVVGLPVALLVRVLGERYPGTYGYLPVE